MEWIFVGRVESMGVGYDEYITLNAGRYGMMATKKFLKIHEKGLDKKPQLCYNKDTKNKGDNSNE